jgi:putative addiction module antidote
MKRKVTAMGNSQGVLIPKEYLERLGLKKGSEVEVQVDEEKGQILIFSISKEVKKSGITPEFAQEVRDFIEEYKPALKKLSK